MNNADQRALSNLQASIPILAASLVGGLALGVSAFLIIAAANRDESHTLSRAAITTQPMRGSEAVAQASASDTAAATAAQPDAACDRQAWPYVTAECRERKAQASVGSSRQVRVVGTGAIIASPTPIVVPKTAKAAPPEPQPAATSGPTHRVAPPTTTAAPAADHVQPTAAPVLQATAGERQPAAPQAEPAAVASTPVYGSATPADEARAARKARAAERKARRNDARARMVVRTIEFSDGRRVTISHPIGRGGESSARAALDRATERELARRSPERQSEPWRTGDAALLED